MDTPLLSRQPCNLAFLPKKLQTATRPWALLPTATPKEVPPPNNKNKNKNNNKNNNKEEEERKNPKNQFKPKKIAFVKNSNEKRKIAPRKRKVKATNNHRSKNQNLRKTPRVPQPHQPHQTQHPTNQAAATSAAIAAGVGNAVMDIK